MGARSRVPRAAPLIAIALLTSGCVLPFPPWWLIPWEGSFEQTTLTIENATEQDWVLRVHGDYPQAFAVPGAEKGGAPIFATSISSIELLTEACDVVDQLDWDDEDAALHVRIEGDGRLVEGATGAEPADTFVEFFECTSGFGFGVAPEAVAPLPEAGGTLVFLGADGGTWQLRPASGELVSVAQASDFAMEQVPSPDGSMIAVVRFDMTGAASDLYLADAGGGNERLLAENAASPVWSPDGSQIAYTDLDAFAGGSALSVVRVDGGEPRRVAEDAALPRWAPDGSVIAFMSADFTAPLDPFEAEFPPTELRLVNPDGSGLRTLADTASPFPAPPAWSPDGASIAFSAAPAGSPTSPLEDPFATTEIQVVDVATGVARDVAQAEMAALAEPAWSPDGSRLAVTATSGGLFSASGSIGLIPTEGGALELLGTLPDAWYTTPVWSPDGRFVAAARTVGMELSSEVVVFDLLGGETVVAVGAYGLSGWRE